MKQVYLLYSTRTIRFVVGIQGKIHLIQEWLTLFSTCILFQARTLLLLRALLKNYSNFKEITFQV